jgi:uracil-DNA glycosylase family 4
MAAAVSLAGASWASPPCQLPQRAEQLQQLREEVQGCQRCPELARSRTQTVFGIGNLAPRVVFFGEAPGADEDRQGEPFVGAAGQLLNKIIQASQMKREDVYILNSLKCRPPANRTPVDSEIANCRPFFERQLEILQPEFIVCLGAVAARAVLQSTESVGRLRGRFHSYRAAKVLVTYHPAYLLRTESAKRFVWEDMQMLMAALGLQLPSPNKP